MQFLCLFFKIRAEIGMRNTDELLRPLSDGLAIQVGHTIFRDHIMHVVTAGDHARALFEHGSDTCDKRSIAQCSRAWQCDDRHAAF